MDTIKLKYREEKIKETIRAYFIKKIGIGLPLVTVLMTIFIIYRIIQGDRSWYVGLVAGVVVSGFILLVSSYLIHIRRSVSRLRRMKTPEAIMEISPEQFRIKSDVGATEIKWSQLSHVQRFPGAWLLFFAGNDFMTLPLEGLSEESKQLVLSKAESNGAKIT